VGVLATALAWAPLRVAGLPRQSTAGATARLPRQSAAGATARQSSARSTAPAAIPSTKNGEWPMYTADLRGSKYSPLDQIDAATSTSSKSRGASRPTISARAREQARRHADHGQRHGLHDGGTRRPSSRSTRDRRAEMGLRPGRGLRARVAAPRQLSGRGLSYWTDGKGDDRIVLRHDRLSPRRAERQTGQPVAVVRQERHRRPERRRRHRQGQADRSRTRRDRHPLDADDRQRHDHRRLVDGRGLGYRYSTNAKGSCARSMRDRQTDLAFNTIPYPGEPGNDTWDKDRGSGPATTACGRRSRSIPKRPGLPAVESPTIDTYGGNPPGQQPVRGDAGRGRSEDRQEKWHFQLVHHPIWDTTSRRRRC
jgi:quinoprotein glucose dehydrogenase